MSKKTKCIFSGKQSMTAFVTVLFLIDAIKASAATFRVINPIKTSDFAIIVTSFLKWILSVSGSVALVMLIIGGITYITSSGDPQKAASAKKLIFMTVGGLIAILLSYSILVIIDSIFS